MEGLLEQDGPIQIVRDGPIGTIILNRPGQANTITLQLTVDMNDALESLDNDEDIGCILITGAGEKHFCGGADLRKIEEMITDEGVTGDPRRNFIRHIEEVSKPVIAVINGAAMGGGCEIALACDYRIIVDDAKIGLPEIRFGALPGAGGTQRLPRLIGLAKAKEMIFVGQPLSADEAQRIGLVTAIASRNELQNVARKLASQLVDKAPYALAAAKNLLNQSLDLSLDEGLALERRLVNGMGSEAERRAFREKSAAENQVYAGIFSNNNGDSN
ncbi:enoyl-CoA hydratase/isomerase family protein [Parasphingorhabdus sp.]|uniref:enoyl-CoA hydratase/isomerase family protein n=1 Tax=Parasphingorhabdus sp. TaxID=2709688 RepID=UPI003A8D9AC6